jgi:diazepam-binding inhibitor (GABA receptor modulating acyl-CoA-binding protein)
MEAQFAIAAKNATILNGSPTNDEKLAIYGLYKQSTVGDVNIPQPYFFDVAGRAKWDVWNTHKGKSTDIAKSGYVEYVNTLILKYGIQTI